MIKKHWNEDTLLEISRQIVGIRTKNDFSDLASSTLQEMLGFSDASILLTDHSDKPYYHFLASTHLLTQDGEFQHHVTKVFNTGKTMVTGGNIFLPLNNEKGVFGSFNLIFDSSDGFTLQDLVFFQTLSNLVSVIISSIVVYEEISQYKRQLEQENRYLLDEIAANNAEIVGSSLEMQKVFQLVSQVSYANSTVLLLGETGTGKELVAKAIHNHSPRKNRMMVKVNCAALPANLIESELFGHERGSFTGALEKRIGKFEMANNGSLFLDEIGELPLDLQVKLLRAIQEKEIERVGGKTTIQTDVRIIVATNRDLFQEVKAGRFRNDLFYRLNVFPITLPPLRERKEDIPMLTIHFIAKYARSIGKNVHHISSPAMDMLLSYHWPGNVRELEHLIERSILLTQGNTIKEIHLPVHEWSPGPPGQTSPPIKTIEENERDLILEVLSRCKGKVFGTGGAAELLGVPVSTLVSKMKRLGIGKEHTITLKKS